MAVGLTMVPLAFMLYCAFFEDCASRFCTERRLRKSGCQKLPKTHDRVLYNAKALTAPFYSFCIPTTLNHRLLGFVGAVSCNCVTVFWQVNATKSVAAHAHFY
jgi:hypothetical protein